MLDSLPEHQRETKTGLVDIKRRRNVVVVKNLAKTGTSGLHFCIAWETFQRIRKKFPSHNDHKHIHFNGKEQCPSPNTDRIDDEDERKGREDDSDAKAAFH